MMLEPAHRRAYRAFLEHVHRTVSPQARRFEIVLECVRTARMIPNEKQKDNSSPNAKRAI